MVKLKFGFLVNPLAGVGGPEGLKGSDACSYSDLVDSHDLNNRADLRALQFLTNLENKNEGIEWITVPHQMGEYHLRQVSAEYSTIDLDIPAITTESHTIDAARQLLNSGIDLLIFVGGDGTARNVYQSVGEQAPVLGIPSGVKMHSGVFAINPNSGADLINTMFKGEFVGYEKREVRDIDESALKNNRVRSAYYGELKVPIHFDCIQAVKQGGGEPDELALFDIMEEIKQRLESLKNCLVIYAPGSTVHFIQQELGIEGSLLGVDVAINDQLLLQDANCDALLKVVEQHPGPIRLVITSIGGQGHLVGRGNQQLTPEILKIITKKNIWVVATERKIRALKNKPLLLDSNDPELDQAWSGFIPIITGYEREILYPIQC